MYTSKEHWKNKSTLEKSPVCEAAKLEAAALVLKRCFGLGL